VAPIERGARRDDPATLTVYEMPAGFH
jgi:hypothetical protein